MYARKFVQKVKEAARKGDSVRKIARESGCSPATVQKFLKDDCAEYRKIKKRKRSKKLDVYRAEIQSLIEHDLRRCPKKQRRTARKLYADFKAAHKDLDVCERTFCRYVKELRSAKDDKLYLPLDFDEATAEADFGQFVAVIDNRYTVCYFLAMVFPFSGQFLAKVYRASNSDCILDGLVSFFEIAGGVPRKILFDNDKTIVKLISKKKGLKKTSSGDGDFVRRLTPRFQEFKTHYGFAPVFCNRGAGNEKGCVERAIRTVRDNYFSPVPVIDNLDAFNQSLLDFCFDYAKKEHHRKEGRIDRMFESEKEFLQPLPQKRFCLLSYRPGTTDKTGCLAFQNVRYGIGRANATVCVESDHEKIRIYDADMRFITGFERIYSKKGRVIDCSLYLDELKNKPGAVDFASQNTDSACDKTDKGHDAFVLGNLLRPYDVEGLYKDL